MIKLEERPLVRFHKGDKIRLIDDRGIAQYRKRAGIVHGTEFTVFKCWHKYSKRRKKKRILVILDGYYDMVFSTRRFELVYSNIMPDELFQI